MPEDPSATTTTEPPPTGDPVAPAPPPADPPKTFTQEDLDKYAGRRAGEAKRKAQQELAEQLGVSVEEAKKYIDAAKEAEDAAKSEAERERDAARAEKEQAAADRAAAAEEKFQAKLERRLSHAGVGGGLDTSKPEEAEQARRLMARALRLVNLEPDADDEQITTEIDQLKADVPGLFTQANGKTPAPSGVTSGAAPPTGGQATTSAIDRGRERYRSTRPDPDQQIDPFSSPAIRRVG